MQYTERQVNAAILAAAKAHRPDFSSLSDREKSSIGQATWYWLKNVFDRLPEEPTLDDLRNDFPLIREVATDFLVAAIKFNVPKQRDTDDEVLAASLQEFHINSQTDTFMRLGLVALQAALAHDEIATMADSFDDMDLDEEFKNFFS